MKHLSLLCLWLLGACNQDPMTDDLASGEHGVTPGITTDAQPGADEGSAPQPDAPGGGSGESVDGAGEAMPGQGGSVQGPEFDPTSSGGSVATSAGCGAASVGQGRVLTDVTVGGVRRQYWLSVPEAAVGEALPVLMAFHGGGGRDEDFPQQQAFESLVQSEGVITVYPLGELLPGNEGEWQLDTTSSNRQDVDFVEAILDDLSSRYCVDQARVYATGYSLGSMFVYELPCQLADRFAAVASFAGTMPVNPTDCAPTVNLGILHIHGAEDWLISYDSEWDWKEWDSVGTMRDIPSLIEFWSQQYGCQDLSETPSGSGTQIVHDTCDQGVRVEHHRLTGVAHDWPGRIDGVSTHQVIWRFVSGFSKR